MDTKNDQGVPQMPQLSNSHRIFQWVGWSALLLGSALLFFVMSPALKQEFLYWERTHAPLTVLNTASLGERAQQQAEFVPRDTQFGIVIPKLEANARVIQDVDWQDAKVYQEALRHGVAHAKGTALPGRSGNVFIFSHSGVDFSEAARYNAVFYLMNKLVVGDEVRLYFEGKPYRYEVFATEKVASDALEYLEQNPDQKILTLMTCWPAGTTWKRLVVQAKLIY